ncbi:MAG: type II toxin-antitoxin system VapC family toxin [Candidatus Korobacteraceae bacterium]
MPARYLLDTNTVSYILKGIPPRVRQRLARIPMEGISISAITEAELRFGLARRPDAKNLRFAVEEFLLRVDILSWDSAAARHYADIRTEIERAGSPMGNMDLMIAAQALSAPATLVSSDRSFHRIKRLKIENWTKP